MQSTADPSVAPPASPAEGWEARLADLDTRLRAWRRAVAADLDRVLRERKLRGLFRKPRPEELRSAEEEARRRAGAGILTELAQFLDELCDVYAKALPGDRAKIRARIGAAEEVFDLYWSYVEAGPSRIGIRGDSSQVLRGLVAVTIDDMRTELARIDVVLGQLLVAAESAGVHWRPILAEAAKVANPGAGGGGACMRSYLEEFPGSMYFREEVLPALREAGRRESG